MNHNASRIAGADSFRSRINVWMSSPDSGRFIGGCLCSGSEQWIRIRSEKDFRNGLSTRLFECKPCDKKVMIRNETNVGRKSRISTIRMNCYKVTIFVLSLDVIKIFFWTVPDRMIQANSLHFPDKAQTFPTLEEEVHNLRWVHQTKEQQQFWFQREAGQTQFVPSVTDFDAGMHMPAYLKICILFFQWLMAKDKGPEFQGIWMNLPRIW